MVVHSSRLSFTVPTYVILTVKHVTKSANWQFLVPNGFAEPITVPVQGKYNYRLYAFVVMGPCTTEQWQHVLPFELYQVPTTRYMDFPHFFWRDSSHGWFAPNTLQWSWAVIAIAIAGNKRDFPKLPSIGETITLIVNCQSVTGVTVTNKQPTRPSSRMSSFLGPRPSSNCAKSLQAVGSTWIQIALDRDVMLGVSSSSITTFNPGTHRHNTITITQSLDIASWSVHHFLELILIIILNRTSTQ